MSFFSKLFGKAPPATEEAPAPSKLAIPAWLQKQDVQLPPWAQVAPVHSPKVAMCLKVDTDAAVAEWLGILGVSGAAIDQYWLEVVYQCIKLDLQGCIARTDMDPRTNNKPVEFHYSRSEQWALRDFPDHHTIAVEKDGVLRTVSGVERASQGREARGHYQRIRGALPM